MPSGPHKRLVNIGLAHAQGGHPLGELLCLFWIHRESSHGRNLMEHIENLKAQTVSKMEYGERLEIAFGLNVRVQTLLSPA
jgi:hypothetical protein